MYKSSYRLRAHEGAFLRRLQDEGVAVMRCVSGKRATYTSYRIRCFLAQRKVNSVVNITARADGRVIGWLVGKVSSNRYSQELEDLVKDIPVIEEVGVDLGVEVSQKVFVRGVSGHPLVGGDVSGAAEAINRKYSGMTDEEIAEAVKRVIENKL